MALLLSDGSVTSKSEPSHAGTTAYVYRWAHIPTEKWYVGSRTAKGSHTIVNWSKNNKNGWTFQSKGVI